MMPLGLLQDGEQALIVGIGEGAGKTCHSTCGKQSSAKGCNAGVAKSVEASSHGACAHENHIEDMGIRAGKEVQMLRNAGRGPLLLKVDETRIAMGRGMAMRILVRRKD